MPPAPHHFHTDAGRHTRHELVDRKERNRHVGDRVQHGASAAAAAANVSIERRRESRIRVDCVVHEAVGGIRGRYVRSADACVACEGEDREMAKIWAKTWVALLMGPQRMHEWYSKTNEAATCIHPTPLSYPHPTPIISVPSIAPPSAATAPHTMRAWRSRPRACTENLAAKQSRAFGSTASTRALSCSMVSKWRLLGMRWNGMGGVKKVTRDTESTITESIILRECPASNINTHTHKTDTQSVRQCRSQSTLVHSKRCAARI